MEVESIPVAPTTSASTGVLLGLALAVTTFVYVSNQKKKKYPPGPQPLPLIGNLSWIIGGGNFMERLADARKKYGDIITLYITSPTVFLNTKEAIYEAFVKNAEHVSLRPRLFNPVYQLTNGWGIISETDGRWQKLRRQLLAVFKEHGVGKVGMEENIISELAYFLDAFASTNQQPVDAKDLLTQSISNIATRIVFGSRFDYTDDQLANLQFDEFMEKASLRMRLPFVKYIPGDPLGYNAARLKTEKGLEFAKEQIKQHKKQFDRENIKDYIDAFLLEMEKEGETDTVYNDENLLAAVMQLYVAGTDTTSTTLYWAFLYLVLYPDIQEKIMQEVDEYVGGRSPRYTDRVNMDFTMSFITEVLRKGVAVGSLMHYASKDLIINGTLIPEGSIVQANVWAACHDEEIFKEAKKFKPDRFLDDNGKFSKPDSKAMIPFSIGRRVCPGEPLARMEMFLFIVGTIQKFKIRLGQSMMPSNEGFLRFVYQPKRYLIELVPRD